MTLDPRDYDLRRLRIEARIRELEAEVENLREELKEAKGAATL